MQGGLRHEKVWEPPLYFTHFSPDLHCLGLKRHSIYVLTSDIDSSWNFWQLITSLFHHQLIGQDDRLGYKTKTTQTPFIPTAVLDLSFINQLPPISSHTDRQNRSANTRINKSIIPPHFKAILGKSERKFSPHPQEAFSHRLSHKICMRLRARGDIRRWSRLTTAKEKRAWGIHPWRPPGE